MLLTLTSLLLTAAPLPTVRDHFPPEGTPTHAFLVVDLESGDLLRVDDSEACAGEAVPLGTGRRFLEALVAFEAGELPPDRSVPCDSTCWARGAHGDVTFVNAYAWGCATYFRELEGDEREIIWQAAAAGLDASGTSLQAWTRFWRRADAARLDVNPKTFSQLMAAAATCVSSPRGQARSLYEPRRGAKAIVGESDAGAWITGVVGIPGGRRWAFALFLREGSLSLAASRCASLLEETRRTYRRSTHSRGGRPWPEIRN